MVVVRRYGALTCVGIVLVAACVAWYAVLQGEQDELTVAFLNVGQGDAILVEAPNGAQLLVDGGPDGAVIRELSRLMPFWDRSLDVVLATHPDADHIGGLPDVLARYNVSLLIDNGAQKDTGAYETLLQLTEAEAVATLTARRGQRLWLDQEAGVYLEILFPDHELANLADANTGSVIARLVYDEIEFLLPGDAPQVIEEYVATLGADYVDADVLKVGHHGSRTASSEYFLAAVAPAHAVISASANNAYGHPHEEVLAALAEVGADVHETHDGADIFYSDGSRVWRD